MDHTTTDINPMIALLKFMEHPQEKARFWIIGWLGYWFDVR
jgi:hypothetical protein